MITTIRSIIILLLLAVILAAVSPIITPNRHIGQVELAYHRLTGQVTARFHGRPSAAVRRALKAHGFQYDWRNRYYLHDNGRYYYNRFESYIPVRE